MQMLPIFLLGILVGVIATIILYTYKKETPSEVKFHIQEATIIRLQNDIKDLKEENAHLNAELSVKELKTDKNRRIEK